MTTVEFLANVLLIVIVVVLVLGGATAGLCGLTIYVLMRARGPLDRRVTGRCCVDGLVAACAKDCRDRYAR